VGKIWLEAAEISPGCSGTFLKRSSLTKLACRHEGEQGGILRRRREQTWVTLWQLLGNSQRQDTSFLDSGKDHEGASVGV
jgi:hypothetical protein